MVSFNNITFPNFEDKPFAELIGEIIKQYPMAHKTIEDETMKEGGVFKIASEMLNDEFEALNITGAEKAKIYAQFMIATTATIVSSVQQAAIQLLSSAYRIIPDTASAQVNAEYQAEQKKILKDSLIQNTLIKLFTETNNMIGTLGAGNMVAPAQMIYQATIAAYKACDLLDITDDDWVNKILPVFKPLFIGDPVIDRTNGSPTGDKHSRWSILYSANSDVKMDRANNVS